MSAVGFPATVAPVGWVEGNSDGIMLRVAVSRCNGAAIWHVLESRNIHQVCSILKSEYYLNVRLSFVGSFTAISKATFVSSNDFAILPCHPHPECMIVGLKMSLGQSATKISSKVGY